MNIIITGSGFVFPDGTGYGLCQGVGAALSRGRSQSCRCKQRFCQIHCHRQPRQSGGQGLTALTFCRWRSNYILAC